MRHIKYSWNCISYQTIPGDWIDKLAILKMAGTKATIVMQICRLFFEEVIQVSPAAIHQPYLAPEYEHHGEVILSV
jgi:hypothetical protein